jgi:hypothetical protein
MWRANAPSVRKRVKLQDELTNLQNQGIQSPETVSPNNRDDLGTLLPGLPGAVPKVFTEISV